MRNCKIALQRKNKERKKHKLSLIKTSFNLQNKFLASKVGLKLKVVVLRCGQENLRNSLFIERRKDL